MFISHFYFLVPFLSLHHFTSAFELPDNSTFSKWSFMLESKLSELVGAVTQVEAIRNSYKPDPLATLHRVNGKEILNKVIKEMTELFEKKKAALKRLVNKAEESVMFREEFTTIHADDISFFNMKEPPRDHKLQYSFRFQQRVSLHQSAVHIPLEIFDGYPELLNGLNWSSALDQVFKENYLNDETISWQYFGSTRGFMRVYPAFKWPDHPGIPDLFDVRRRSWYVHSSVSSKDVIILIDRSGSVHGQTIEIMKITVKSLLNTLGENDYVNVAWFNNKVNWVVPCMDTLIQATAQNRRILSDAIDNLAESNYTSYTTALDFAFEAFNKFDQTRKPWEGANCHRAIMFLSDGSTEWPSELVTKHCNETKGGRIRIFTFACGPHPIPTVVLKEMACATGGFFSPITALGSVRVKVSDYIRVLSRPVALSNNSDMFEWHNFYRDVGGLGMITTVTLPVFNKFSSTVNPTLLGVMGIDVPVQEMVKVYPRHQLGPFGYGFSVNTNGFVVFHPRLRDHITYIEDPPDVDFSDLEVMVNEKESKMESMRNDMIDGKAGSVSFTSLVPVGLGISIPVAMDYYYDAVNSSTFRFGIAVPQNEYFIKIQPNDMSRVTSLVVALDSIEGVLLAPWNYCPHDEGEESLTPKLLAQRIIDSNFSCDEELVNHLLWDVQRIDAIRGYWQQSTLSGIKSRFIMTTGGVTQVYPTDTTQFFNRQRDPLKNNLFKRAARKSGCVFSISRTKTHELSAACRVLFLNKYVLAVVGGDIERQLVQDIFDDVTATEIDNVSCQDSQHFHCFLLNEGGSIIATNQQDQRPGDFIGLYDPQLLEQLLKDGILGREYRYNFQSWCSNSNTDIDVPTQAASTFPSLVTFVYSLLYTLNWSWLGNLLMYSFTSSLMGESTQGVIVGIGKNYKHNHSCVTRSSWYYYTGVQAHSGSYSCEDCQRNIRTSFLPNITLLFVVSQPPCQCNTTFEPLTLDPVEDPGPYNCHRRQKYRKRPDHCYTTVPKDNRTDCGAGNNVWTIKISVPLLITCSWISWMYLLT